MAAAGMKEYEPIVDDALAWARKEAGKDSNKPAALLSSSPGPLGGLRAMTLMRQYLQGNFAMIVAPQQYALGRAGEAFDAAGALKDAKSQQMVEHVLDAIGELASALKPR